MKEINMNKELTNEQLAIAANRILKNEDVHQYDFVVELSKDEKFMERYNILKEKIADPKTSELERFYAKKAFKNEYEHYDFLLAFLNERNNMVGWLNGECELSELNKIKLTYIYYTKVAATKPSFFYNVPAWVYVINVTLAAIIICEAAAIAVI